jgi:hypothetical protein
MTKTWVGKETFMELYKAFGWMISQSPSLELRKSLALLLYEELT